MNIKYVETYYIIFIFIGLHYEGQPMYHQCISTDWRSRIVIYHLAKSALKRSTGSSNWNPLSRPSCGGPPYYGNYIYYSPQHTVPSSGHAVTVEGNHRDTRLDLGLLSQLSIVVGIHFCASKEVLRFYIFPICSRKGHRIFDNILDRKT